MSWQQRLAVLLLPMAIIMLSACSQPKTAGNAAILFFNELDVEDYEGAYARVCDAAKRQMSFDEFRHGGVSEFAPPAFFGVEGDSSDIKEDIKTASDDVVEASVFIDAHKGDITQRWRIGMVKENGRWKLCTFEFVSERPRVFPPDPARLP